MPVVTDLDDPDANRVVAALVDDGIAAEKAADPTASGRYQVDVPRAEAARAVSVMGEQGLPPRKTPGMSDALGSGALVPSRSAEHERLLTGLAGELEKTLGAVDGVASARVHLAVPRRDPLLAESGKATASVLLRFRGAQTPLSIADIRELVTHAVPALEPANVFVAVVPVPPPVHARALERFGPLTTDHSTARALRLALFGLALLGLALTASLLLLWRRARRASRQALRLARRVSMSAAPPSTSRST